ncbi:MAG: acyl-CoA dehydrogenase [Planctomycetes bacterium]|nr:acyl-CoA dehydrogenase [Planctomycetota bacterium]
MQTAFDLTEEQQMIRESVRKFALEEVEPIATEIDEHQRFATETWEKMGALGLTGIPISEEYGGAGLDTLSYILAVEELARVCASTSLSYAAHVSLGTYPIYAWGSEELKRKYVPKLASGEHMGAYGLTEPGAGSDAGGTKTMAVRDGDQYVLNGRKCFITNANYAQTFVCTAVTEPGKGAKGISAFVVERDTPGFLIEKGEVKLGMRGSDWGSLVFDDCRVPVGNMVGPEGEGFATFMKTLEGGRISIGALSLGIAQGALDKALSHAQVRQAFGKPLAAQQAVQFKLATMATEIDAARHLVYHAARLKDAGRAFGKEGAMAKLFASEVAMRASYEAIQIYGGVGYSREYPVERYLRDAKLCTIGEGTSEIQRLVIARQILKDAS